MSDLMSFPEVGSEIEYFTSNAGRAVRRGAQHKTVYWLQPDGDSAVIFNVRLMEQAFEIPRIPLAAAKRWGDTIEKIVKTIALTEGAVVDAAEWPDGTIAVMFTKENR